MCQSVYHISRVSLYVIYHVSVGYHISCVSRYDYEGVDSDAAAAVMKQLMVVQLTLQLSIFILTLVRSLKDHVNTAVKGQVRVILHTIF